MIETDSGNSQMRYTLQSTMQVHILCKHTRSNTQWLTDSRPDPSVIYAETDWCKIKSVCWVCNDWLIQDHLCLLNKQWLTVSTTQLNMYITQDSMAAKQEDAPGRPGLTESKRHYLCITSLLPRHSDVQQTNVSFFPRHPKRYKRQTTVK